MGDTDQFEKNIEVKNLHDDLDSHLETYFSLKENYEARWQLARIIWDKKIRYEALTGQMYLHKGHGCLLLPLEHHVHAFHRYQDHGETPPQKVDEGNR